MADKNTYPTKVAAVLVRCVGRLLLVYNTKWRAFTFPMTKLRPWEITKVSSSSEKDQQEVAGEIQREHWLDTAAHAVVEVLGIPSSPKPLLDGSVEVEYSEVDRSGRDGANRDYHYKLFTVDLPAERQSQAGLTVWLTPEEALSGSFRPMSPTVMKILNDQEVNKIVSQW